MTIIKDFLKEVSLDNINHWDIAEFWNVISSKAKLSEEMIAENIDKLSLFYVLQKNPVSEAFLLKFTDKIFCRTNGLIEFHKDTIIPECILIKYFCRIDLAVYGTWHKIPISVFRQHKNKLRWDSLCYYYTFSEEELLEFRAYINWHYAVKYQNLTELVLETCKDHIVYCWKDISLYQAMSEDFIRKHKSCIHFRRLLHNEKIELSEAFFEEFKEYLCE